MFPLTNKEKNNQYDNYCTKYILQKLFVIECHRDKYICVYFVIIHFGILIPIVAKQAQFLFCF